MDISKEITKDVFEKWIPAAKMPERNDSVYKRMAPFFQQALMKAQWTFFGDGFKQLIDDDEYKDDVIAYICQYAFVTAISSLDLVLTGTGFGIVSTNDTSPASQQRVKALRDDLQWQRQLSAMRIIDRLRKVKGWGDTTAATTLIGSFYYNPEYLEKYGPRDVSLSLIDNWLSVRVYQHSAETLIRRELSFEYYTEVLKKLRSASMSNADLIVYYHSLDFIAEYINAVRQNRQVPNVKSWGLRDYLEKYLEDFPAYQNSSLYSKLHTEHYKNKKNDTSFFFV